MDWQAVSLFHVTFVTSAPLFCLLVVVVLGGFWFCVWCCGFWGALDDFFLTSSSRDMTATVLSNAALEKRIAPCVFQMEKALTSSLSTASLSCSFLCLLSFLLVRLTIVRVKVGAESVANCCSVWS